MLYMWLLILLNTRNHNIERLQKRLCQIYSIGFLHQPAQMEQNATIMKLDNDHQQIWWLLSKWWGICSLANTTVDQSLNLLDRELCSVCEYTRDKNKWWKISRILLLLLPIAHISLINPASKWQLFQFLQCENPGKLLKGYSGFYHHHRHYYYYWWKPTLLVLYLFPNL